MPRQREPPPSGPRLRLRPRAARVGDGRSPTAGGGWWLGGRRGRGRGREESSCGGGVRGARGGVVPPGDGCGGGHGGGSGGRGRSRGDGGGGSCRGDWRDGAARGLAESAADSAAAQGAGPGSGRAARPLCVLLHGRNFYHDALALEGAFSKSTETHFLKLLLLP